MPEITSVEEIRAKLRVFERAPHTAPGEVVDTFTNVMLSYV